MFEGEELKREVNNFVWMYCDGKTTLDEAEAIAVKIFMLLRPDELPEVSDITEQPCGEAVYTS